MNRKYMKLWALLLAFVLLTTAGVLTAGAAPRSGGTALPDSVYVGGMPFGVMFYTEGILVVGCSIASCAARLSSL